jgi:hypothetical protein
MFNFSIVWSVSFEKDKETRGHFDFAQCRNGDKENMAHVAKRSPDLFVGRAQGTGHRAQGTIIF